MIKVIVLAEDTRETTATAIIRRGRLAYVLKNALNARRAARQTIDQMRGAGNTANYAPESKIPSAIRRLQTLAQRYNALKNRQGKAMRIWAKASSWQISNLPHRGKFHNRKTMSRPALDTATRPANNKTYGRGSWANYLTRNKP